MPRRCAWCLCLPWLGLLLAAPSALALDVGSLKLIVAELSYPLLNFTFGVNMTQRDFGAMLPERATALRAAAEARLAENPDDAQAHLDRGLALKVLEETDAAAEFARAAELWRPTVEAQPGNTEAKLGLARALTEKGDWEAAQPLVGELAEQHPELWWPHFALGERSAEALGSLVMVHLGVPPSMRAPDPTDPRAVAEWARCLPVEYADAFVEALRKAQEDPEAFRTLAGQLAEEAVAHLQAAAHAAPDEIAPPLGIANVQGVLWTLEAASHGERTLAAYRATFDTLARLADDHPELIRLRLFVSFQRVMEAMMRGQVDGFVDVWGRFGPEDQQLLTSDEATIRGMLDTPASQISDTYELAALYPLMRGDIAGGLETLRQNTERDATSAERWEAYLGALGQTRGIDAAQAPLEQALAHLDSGKLRCALAKVYASRDDTDSATAELGKAIALNDDHAAFAQVMLGVLRLKSGDFEGAVAPLQAAAPQRPDDALCHAALGLALALTGKQAEAAAEIGAATRLDANSRLFAHAADIIGK